jgi:hypothetical protein
MITEVPVVLVSEIKERNPFRRSLKEVDGILPVERMK